jgi:hypothetical protein
MLDSNIDGADACSLNVTMLDSNIDGADACSLNVKTSLQ